MRESGEICQYCKRYMLVRVQQCPTNGWCKAFHRAFTWDDSSEEMLASVRASLQARLEGRNEGGDVEVMRLVDEIVKQALR